ncbi:hypothetical protein B0H16DRAFT_1470891 [Mycena metata]|uniref:Uncharacterized protein n=1 Tax=Mycena metata TaxID=1033252 RepID=A0AAD7HT16_9AGAR|nr:hypothetical protein B0H16DRAFT_1470891 [Mycena metata]
MRLRDPTATREQRELAAEADFEELCLKPLRKAQDKETPSDARTSGLSGGVKAKPDWVALDGLVETTRDLIDKRFGGDAWIVSAMAQRTSVDEKGLASSTKFPGSKLETCLNTVHKEMTDSWNLYDPDDLLQTPEFVTKIRKLAQLVTPPESEVRSSLPNFDQIQTIVGIVVTAGVVAVVPTIVAIGLSLWFVNLLIEGYRNTPETLRCFMGYIVDLSLVMDQIFHITIARAARPLTDKDIDEALENYKNANLGAVHREIRAYAGKATIAQIIAAGPAEVKLNHRHTHARERVKPRPRLVILGTDVENQNQNHLGKIQSALPGQIRPYQGASGRQVFTDIIWFEKTRRDRIQPERPDHTRQTLYLRPDQSVAT